MRAKWRKKRVRRLKRKKSRLIANLRLSRDQGRFAGQKHTCVTRTNHGITGVFERKIHRSFCFYFVALRPRDALSLSYPLSSLGRLKPWAAAPDQSVCHRSNGLNYRLRALVC
ncbi:hypothetical protein GQ53DRAFT_73022 [Thozetella sp. PMI_491]|nr:hypothetical protein GQ53DRAFT_73022 [Thozetella sp. PMI_491]